MRLSDYYLKLQLKARRPINTPWRGQYVVHLLHVDKTPGEFGGKKYDALRKQGTNPGPALPPQPVMD